MSKLNIQRPVFCPKCGNKISMYVSYDDYRDIEYNNGEDTIKIPFSGDCPECRTSYYWYYECSMTVENISNFITEDEEE